MNKRWVSLLLPVGLLLLLIISTTVALAGSTKVGELLDDQSGDVFELFENDDGSFFVWVHHADGTLSGFDIPSEGNPDPDDPDGIGGKPDIKELARRYHQGTLGKAVQTNNPFNIQQSARGKGRDPRWNPPENVRDPDGAGGGPGGAPKDAAWIKDQARKGTGGEDDEDRGGQGGQNERPGIGETGSVQPERVNPVPFLRTQSDVHSMENWQPPVEAGTEARDTPPMEGPAHTSTTTSSGEKASPPPEVAPSSGHQAPEQDVQTPQGTTVRPTVKVAPASPAVRVQSVRQ